MYYQHSYILPIHTPTYQTKIDIYHNNKRVHLQFLRINRNLYIQLTYSLAHTHQVPPFLILQNLYSSKSLPSSSYLNAYGYWRWGTIIVGVSLSELFLAFGSYFRAMYWYYSPFFPWRLHKLMVETIRLVTQHAGRSFHRARGFLFWFPFTWHFRVHTVISNKGVHFLACRGISIHGEKTLR